VSNPIRAAVERSDIFFITVGLITDNGWFAIYLLRFLTHGHYSVAVPFSAIGL
jgi:hypothetical protein